MVLLWIILAVGMAHMIKTGKFGKAFAFGEILSIIRGIGWVKYIGWIVVVVIIAVVISSISRAHTPCWMADLRHSPADPRRLRFQVHGAVVQ